MSFDAIVVGSGLCGSVIARELAKTGNRVLVLEKRSHVGGNLYDFRQKNGFLVQKYGPHTFHTKDKNLFDYISRYEEWEPFSLRCGAIIDGIETPSPFNFKTIDQFYSPKDAEDLKKRLENYYGFGTTATVVEVLENKDPKISAYARFLFEKDYSPYTAKQWGISPSEIDLSVLKRVPLRFSYREGYFDDTYEVMPKHSFTAFIENLLNHENIECKTGVDAIPLLSFKDNKVIYEDKAPLIVFTGPLDALFAFKFGELPYRSLRFEFKSAGEQGIQKYPVTAYPEAKDFTRITDYRHLPEQPGYKETTYAVEYSLPYKPGEKNEPFYPILTESSKKQYRQYETLAKSFSNLYCCGRLAEFKYYNMDQALKKALEIAERILSDIETRGVSL